MTTFTKNLTLAMALLIIACGGTTKNEEQDIAKNMDELVEEIEEITGEQLSDELTHADVEKFIKTFPDIVKDMDALDGEVDFGDETTFEAAFKAPKVIAVLEKYGWGKEFLPKFTVIMTGYSLNKMNEELENMSEDERKMAAGMMGELIAPMRELVTEEQQEIIKEHMGELGPMFEKLDNN